MTAAERGEQADAPVAKLVEAALDHDGAIVGNGARRGLIVEVTQQIFGGDAVEIVLSNETFDGGRPRRSA